MAKVNALRERVEQPRMLFPGTARDLPSKSGRCEGRIETTVRYGEKLMDFDNQSSSRVLMDDARSFDI